MENLDDLAYFALVAQHGGFAAAERVTRIPKSRLSRRLAELERRLGTRLVQRSTRRFAITPVGEQVLQHARAMLSEAEAAQALVDEQSSAPRGSLRLACPPALLQAAVSPMLERFLNAWPDVQMQVLASNRSIDVWQDGIDLTLRVRARDAVLPQEEIVRPLALSPHLLVAAPSLLTARPPITTPADLARLPTLALGHSSSALRLTLYGPGGGHAEQHRPPRLIVNDATALRDAALAGVGCAALPRLLVHDALQSGALQEVLPGWAPAPGLIQAAYASREGLRPVVRRLLDDLVGGFTRLIAQGRCLAPPDANQTGAAPRRGRVPKISRDRSARAASRA
ncbi:MAG: LysR family transcriptional regulator [Burkholderiaceae bacterium]|nr:MAG: LysR family transcriptional regulator [Burkholderiaceae bacterium]